MDVKKARIWLEAFFNKTNETLVFKRREIILSISEPIPHAYRIQRGFVKAITYNNKGEERLQYVYGPGEIFPLAQLFDHPVETQTFQAVSNVKLQVSSAKEFTELLTNKAFLVVAIVNQMLSFIDRIYSLNLAPADQRVMYTLLLFADRFGVKEDSHIVINLALTQQEIGDMLRMTRESAGLKLKELEDQGVLVQGRRQIRVYPDELKKLLDN